MPVTVKPNIPKLANTVMKIVPAGSTAVLNCDSNDYSHNFMFWLLDKNKIVGPGNEYEPKKYKYEVLSGNLHINNVSPYEAGYYKCVSKELNGSEFSVAEIELVVDGSGFSAIDTFKLIAILISILVIIGSMVLYCHLRKEWKKCEDHRVLPGEDDKEEDGDEVYNSTTTTKTKPSPVPGPSRNQSSDHLMYGIDNQGLDTDFNSVFENIQIKTPERSLI